MTTKFRSRAEKRVADWLDANGIKWEYEIRRIPFLSRIRSGVCGTCEAKTVYQKRNYIPDFYIPDGDFFIEVKGRLTRRDRGKMKDIKDQHPEIDIRILFSKDNKLEKHIPTRYSQWSDDAGYTAAIGAIPPIHWFKRSNS